MRALGLRPKFAPTLDALKCRIKSIKSGDEPSGSITFTPDGKRLPAFGNAEEEAGDAEEDAVEVVTETAREQRVPAMPA